MTRIINFSGSFDMEEARNNILCGDCLSVMKAMPDKCIDIIITSPPYNIGKEYVKWIGKAASIEQPNYLSLLLDNHHLNNIDK